MWSGKEGKEREEGRRTGEGEGRKSLVPNEERRALRPSLSRGEVAGEDRSSEEGSAEGEERGSGQERRRILRRARRTLRPRNGRESARDRSCTPVLARRAPRWYLVQTKAARATRRVRKARGRRGRTSRLDVEYSPCSPHPSSSTRSTLERVVEEWRGSKSGVRTAASWSLTDERGGRSRKPAPCPCRSTDASSPLLLLLLPPFHPVRRKRVVRRSEAGWPTWRRGAKLSEIADRPRSLRRGRKERSRPSS